MNINICEEGTRSSNGRRRPATATPRFPGPSSVKVWGRAPTRGCDCRHPRSEPRIAEVSQGKRNRLSSSLPLRHFHNKRTKRQRLALCPTLAGFEGTDSRLLAFQQHAQSRAVLVPKAQNRLSIRQRHGQRQSRRVDSASAPRYGRRRLELRHAAKGRNASLHAPDATRSAKLR